MKKTKHLSGQSASRGINLKHSPLKVSSFSSAGHTEQGCNPDSDGGDAIFYRRDSSMMIRIRREEVGGGVKWAGGG